MSMITETMDRLKDPKAMSVKHWFITQNNDATIRETKYLINNKGLKGRKVYSQDAPSTKQYFRQHGHLVLWGVQYKLHNPIKEGSKHPLQLVISQDYGKKALQGCHVDIRHLGIE